MKRFSLFIITISFVMFSMGVPAQDVKEAYQQARESSEIAGYSLSKVQRWLHEKALPVIDEKTGLYIADGHWNYRDTAADCYPFLTWAAWVVDQEVLNHEVRSILDAEQALCNHLDRIPVPYDLKTNKQVDLDYDEMIFQASEYVKDGLIAIVEITGDDEWFDRMRAIEDDIWKHARYKTEYGMIPSKNVEVNGEQIQALVRLYTMTGETSYLEYAERLADYYLSNPEWVPNRLRDHGCEIIGGLGLLLGVESTHNPPKAKEYANRIKTMLDAVLEKGTNEDGFMFNEIESKQASKQLSDGWGYNYVTYLCYDMVTGTNQFTPQVRETLRNSMKPAYKDYRWEGSIDGYADSIEGAIYLLNRVPVKEGFNWVDREMANNVIYADEPLDEAPLWGTMKLQANGVRTVILHALMHTRGVVARPWQKGMQLGAAPYQDGIVLSMRSEKAWQGILEFDLSRHRLYMGFAKNWPRMNTIPEWFTVDPGQHYAVTVGSADPKTYTGAQLHHGLAVSLEPNQEVQIVIQ